MAGLKGSDSLAKGENTTGFTWKAVTVGVLLSLFLSIASPYSNMMIQPMGMSADFVTAGAVFLFFVFVGGAITILRLINRRLSFSQSELMIIYSMLIVASAIPSWGLVEAFLPILTGSFYYATPENGWAEIIQPYIRRWMTPQDPAAIKYFYEGLPKGESIPWGVWVKPLLAWLPFIIVLYFVMICMMTILRKQWVEKERLIFPLTQLPLEMAKDGEEGSFVNPFFKSKIMWLGFSIPFIISSWNALHEYFHFIPPLILSHSYSIFRRTTGIIVMLSFPAIGFAYLVDLDVALSVWLFHLLNKVQSGIFNVTGFRIEGHREVFNASSPSLTHQGMGAMIILVLFGLWMARGHLKDVFKKAFAGGSSIDDSDEAISYRTAVLGMIIGLVFIACWLRASGLPFPITLLSLFGAFVIFLGLTRIIAQGGVGFARAPCIPQTFVVYGIGSAALRHVELTALAFTYVWASDIRTIVMTSTANAFKLADVSGVRKRPLFWAIMIAILVSLGGSIWVILMSAYLSGGINLHRWFFKGAPVVPFDFITDKINNPASIAWGRWLFTGIGGAFMGLLMFARHRLLWWPIHYIGFPIADTFPVRYTWFSVFIAWLLKAIILKYGGPKLYRSVRPFFLGLILGQFSCAGIWLVIDSFTGMVGNIVTIGVI